MDGAGVILVLGGLVLAALGLVLLILVPVMAARDSRRRSEVQALLRVPPVPGRVTQDQVVRSTSMSMIGTSLMPMTTTRVVMTVEFLPPGGRVPVSGHPLLRDTFGELMTGRTVAVHCDPADPRRFVAARYPGRFDATDTRRADAAVWLMGVVGLFLIGGGFLLMIGGIFV